MPVSYTHLDVYKRQHVKRSRRARQREFAIRNLLPAYVVALLTIDFLSGEFAAASHVRLQVPVVTSDAECSFGWVARETDEFVLAFAQLDQLALRVVTEDGRACAEIRRRGQDRGGDLDVRGRHIGGGRRRRQEK